MSESGEADVRLRAVVRGRVQGVNFRYYAVRAARRLGLTGWIANRWDGNVETVADGPRAALLEYKAALERGSPSSYVDLVEVHWDESSAGGFQSFNVRYL